LDNISKQTRPFASGIFTLSSHHPYPIPEQLTGKFPTGNLTIHESIGYTDYALRNFIDACKKQPWFDRTIFVITADHSAQNQLHAYRTPSGKYAIPLLIYAPGILSPQKIYKTVSHIDIFPTILDLVNHPDSTRTLGTSIFSKTERGVTHFDNSAIHFTHNKWTLNVVNDNAVSLYDKRSDVNCEFNLVEAKPALADSLKESMHLNMANYYNLIGSPSVFK